MTRRIPTPVEKTMHRASIAALDLIECARFADAALKLERPDRGQLGDVTYNALVCAALVYYARPFSGNEHPNPKKRPRRAADRAVVLSPHYLRKLVPSAGRRRLHRVAIRLRNKMVAHAESRFFPLEMVGPKRGNPNKLALGFWFEQFRPLPVIDLAALIEIAAKLAQHFISEANKLGELARPARRLRTR
jgi:hypothetical protein